MMPMAEVEAPPLAAQIRAAVESGSLTLPPLPEVATRVINLLEDEANIDAAKLTELIALDSTIAAGVLRAANSAAFGGLRAISDVDQAVARLGARQIGALVTSAAVKGHFGSGDPVKLGMLHSLWGHALATGVAARRLAAADGGDVAEAFLAGLLHDMGKLLVLKGVDHLEQAGATALTPAVLDELINILHAELGHQSLASWRISEPICQVALRHHKRLPATSEPLLLRVQAANAIAKKLGAHPKPEPELNLLDVPAVERLNLGDLEVASLLVDVEDELIQVRSLF
ncbi:MAG: HDOD domain-containing protein [Gemmatimonadales bacterium]